jgi:hypothetical protein
MVVPKIIVRFWRPESIDFALLKKVMVGGSQRCDYKLMLSFWKDGF